MDNLRVYFATWNVGTSSPDQDLHHLLSLSHNPKNDKILHDFYVISFQEVKSQPQNMLMSYVFDDPWTSAVRDILETRDYVKLKSIRLQGLILSVFLLRRHLLNVRQIESEYTRTGLSGMWGNKGAVSIRLSIYGCSVCFVNSHLSAHGNQLKDRIEDYNSIIKDHKFHVAEHTEIFYHDYVFWMGDLNFRLSEDFIKTPAEVERSIKEGDLRNLLQHDQLRQVMTSGEAFSELTENAPTFPPTFKYEIGTSEYDHKRRPAWTDRILYRVNPNNYENITLKVTQNSYGAHDYYILSDHKPVTADFVIKIPPTCILDAAAKSLDAQVFADYAERVVLFDKITIWYLDEDNSATYKFTQEVPKTKDDWIGVFKENFSSLDDYIIYEYVSRGSSPVPTSRSPARSMGVRQPMKYTITFPELPSRSSGMFRLIYFSQTDDNVQSVLGISDAFPVKEKEDTD